MLLHVLCGFFAGQPGLKKALVAYGKRARVYHFMQLSLYFMVLEF